MKAKWDKNVQCEDVRPGPLSLPCSFWALSHVSPPLPRLRLSVPIHLPLPLPLPHSFAPPDGVFLRRPVTQLNVSGLLPVSFFSLFTLFLWSCQVTRTVQNSNCSCLSYENMHFSSLSLSLLSLFVSARARHLSHLYIRCGSGCKIAWGRAWWLATLIVVTSQIE